MLFRKKETGGMSVPVEKIREMSSVGMSDKDIIKKLKKEGYSYEDIEKAMLEAVKEGVGEGPVRRTASVQAPTRMEDNYNSEPSTLEDVYGREVREDMPEMSTSVPELAAYTEEADVPGSDVIIEELVEGVVEEKWQKLTEKLDRYEEKFEKIDEITKQLESKIDVKRDEFPTKEIEGKITDFSTRLEDLEARIGGLEKAFRQFLPSLTRNIENLSNIIHEMKERVPAI
jgi:DNA repair exonuclease SbcCD ATPase subunit